MSHHHRMMLQRYGLGHTTSLYSAVQFDPIFTPLFTALFTSIGFSASAAGIAASISTAIATTALSIGIQMLMAPKPPKAEDGKAPLTQAIPYRNFVVGRTRLAGARMLWEASGANLFCVQAIAGHRIHAVNRYYLHDDVVTLGTNIVGGMAAVNGLANGRYSKGGVRIASRLGLPAETPYALLVTNLGSAGIWTSDHRGDGQASVALVAQNAREKDQQKSYPYGPPNLSVEVDGAHCWDFRNPAQDPEDPSTWGFTQNSALVMAWHQCFNEFGHRRDYRKALLPVLDMWKEEANICDEDVPRASGGTEKRYQCNGWDTTENGPKAATNAILASCDGWICERGDGALLFTVGKFRDERVAVLTDSDIVGHQIQYGVLPEDAINRLVPKFTYPATDYTTSDTDFFEDTDAQLEEGRVLSEEANYQWVHQWRQARRLGKRDWLRLQQKVKGSIDVRLSGINAIYARWVRLDTPNRLPRLNGKLVENRRSILALTKGGFSMDIVQHPDDIDAWTPATDEGQQPPVPPAPNAAGISEPVIQAVQAIATGGSVYLKAVITDPGNDSLTPVLHYRVLDDGSGSPGAWVEQAFPDASADSGVIIMSTSAVPADTTLQVEAALKTSKGSYSDWSPTETVVTTSDPTPPGVATGVGVSAGSGTATFSWTAPNSENYVGAKIYIGATNAFGTSTFYPPAEYGAPGAADSRTVSGLSAGVKYAWIVSVNGSDVAGTPVATGSFTVT